MDRTKKLAEGKTKIIWEAPNPEEVLIESKDDITAGDGAKRDTLTGKAVYATTTTCNCFNLLGYHGIHTHFSSQIDERTFLARNVKMIPIELVARRLATGSYIKRHPEVPEGARFEKIELEHFEKDDARHDPLLTYDFNTGTITLNDPKVPLGQGVLEQRPMLDAAKERVQWEVLNKLTEETFWVLERAWAKQNVTLVDLKIECGWHKKTARIIVADVIDNDSWRIWPEGKKAKMLDKQVYRDLSESTPEALREVLANYAAVATATEKFFSARHI